MCEMVHINKCDSEALDKLFVCEKPIRNHLKIFKMYNFQQIIGHQKRFWYSNITRIVLIFLDSLTFENVSLWNTQSFDTFLMFVSNHNIVNVNKGNQPIVIMFFFIAWYSRYFEFIVGINCTEMWLIKAYDLKKADCPWVWGT